MLDNLKKELKKAQLSNEVIKINKNLIDELLNKSNIFNDISNPNIERNYVVGVPIFYKNDIYSDLRESKKNFEKYFFNKTYFINLDSNTRKRVNSIHKKIFGKPTIEDDFSGIETIFEKDKLNPITYPISPLELENKLDLLLKSISGLNDSIKLKIEKEISINAKKNLVKEKDLVDDFYQRIKLLSIHLNKINTFNSIKAKIKDIELNMSILINNKHIKKETNSKNLKDLFSFFKNEASKNSLAIGGLIHLSKVLLSENLEYEKEIKSKSYQLEEFEKRQKEKEEKDFLKKQSKEIDDITKSSQNKKLLNSVMKEAKDVSTAIRHSQVGQDVALFFNSNNPLNQEIDTEKENQEHIIQKIERTGYKFEYGKKEDIKKENFDVIKNKTIGISLSDLLKNSDLTPEQLEKILKNKNNL